jgi:hypothetical protein
MVPITKLMKKTEQFLWTSKCQVTWERIKQKYVEAPIWYLLIGMLSFMYIQMHLY